jgi:hypothetical protein
LVLIGGLFRPFFDNLRACQRPQAAVARRAKAKAEAEPSMQYEISMEKKLKEYWKYVTIPPPHHEECS